MLKTLNLLLIASLFAACGSSPANKQAVEEEILEEEVASLEIMPVSHASFVMSDGTVTLYNDPVGGPETWSPFPAADIVLVSDIHGDHLDSTTLEAVVKEGTALVVPQAVADKLSPKLAAMATIMANGETKTVKGISIEALPMYNLREEALKFHTKGRGNGYVLTMAGERIYIAGDTEDIEEMRQLKNIDRAFVCMNLPYTMPVDAAADAVVAFAPATVYPYHFRGTDGLSDTAQFRAVVEASNRPISVIGLDWYPEME